jgi:hypothetical protein
MVYCDHLKNLRFKSSGNSIHDSHHAFLLLCFDERAQYICSFHTFLWLFGMPFDSLELVFRDPPLSEISNLIIEKKKKWFR